MNIFHKIIPKTCIRYGIGLIFKVSSSHNIIYRKFKGLRPLRLHMVSVDLG